MLIIARAMMKRQEERFCDAQEMLRALQDIHAIDGRYKKGGSFSTSCGGGLSCPCGIRNFWLSCLAYSESAWNGTPLYDAPRAGKAGRPPMKMRFDEAEQDLQQAIAIYDDRFGSICGTGSPSLSAGEKYQECIDAVETTQSRELKYYSRQSVANLYNVAAELLRAGKL